MLLRIRGRHVRDARSWEHCRRPPPMRPMQPIDPARLLRQVNATAAQMGVKWVSKRLRGHSTAVAPRVFVGTNYGKKADHDKAAHKAHELVHIRQQRAGSLTAWLARYGTDPRFRWTVEMQAHREQLRWLKRGGVGPSELKRWAEKQADEMRGEYQLWRVKGSDVHSWTRTLLMEVI